MQIITIYHQSCVFCYNNTLFLPRTWARCKLPVQTEASLVTPPSSIPRVAMVITSPQVLYIRYKTLLTRARPRGEPLGGSTERCASCQTKSQKLWKVMDFRTGNYVWEKWTYWHQRRLCFVAPIWTFFSFEESGPAGTLITLLNGRLGNGVRLPTWPTRGFSSLFTLHIILRTSSASC